MKTYIAIYDVDKYDLKLATVQAKSKREALKEFTLKYSTLLQEDEVFADDFYVRKCDAMFAVTGYINGNKRQTEYYINRLHAETTALYMMVVLYNAMVEADKKITNTAARDRYTTRVSDAHDRFDVIRNGAEVIFSFCITPI
jgi:hypothetical protein